MERGVDADDAITWARENENIGLATYMDTHIRTQSGLIRALNQGDEAQAEAVLRRV